MSDPDLDGAAEAVELAHRVVDAGVGQLAAAGAVDDNQVLAYEVAHSAAAVEMARPLLDYGRLGPEEAAVTCAFVADVVAGLAGSVFGREAMWGVEPGALDPARGFVTAYRDPAFLGELATREAPRHLDADFELVRETFRAGGESDYLGMIVATEELSRGSLGIGGSLITRPEILTRALVKGGTEEQKHEWLPRLATGEVMVAVAVTEPDFGSDVAGIKVTAAPIDGGWLVNGVKTWCTFAGRADVLMLLARTDPDRSRAHRGLSLFVVPKPRGEGHGFEFADRGGKMEGRAIDTIGYRGMHSYEIAFDNWFVAADHLVGGEAGQGRGFYLQMAGFENGRLQTAARAVGVMQAAYEAARNYAADRVVFGRPIADYGLTRAKLGRMAAVIQAARQFSYVVGRLMAKGEGTLEAAMVKAYVCKAAEWVTREAMQIHGGFGYAEEYAVSRYFVDARVLSIFEGADETLCLKVVARRLVEGRA